MTRFRGRVGFRAAVKKYKEKKNYNCFQKKILRKNPSKQMNLKREERYDQGKPP